LNAATLQDHCYWKMFSGCSKLTNVFISATNIVADKCLTDWLKDAGTSSTGTPTVLVANSSMVDPIKSTLNTTIWTVTVPTEPE